MAKNYTEELDFILDSLINEYENINEGVKFYEGEAPKTTKEKVTEMVVGEYNLKEWEINVLFHRLLIDKQIISIEPLTISLDGIVFKGKGGYTEKSKLDDLENIRIKVLEKEAETDPYAEQLSEHTPVVLGPQPKTHYDTEAKAIEHRSKLSNITTQLEEKAIETDPYSEQIADMEREALQTVDFEIINKLTKTLEHQKFLLDLLTSKDSFVRKKIIDQNLSYLNSRLTHYLDKIGLPHNVIFKNDLQVEITELGRELDFDNLSRGERNRLILGLSFAFRDVWENLYVPINTLFIDELIDSGLDTMGVENSIAILKDMSRTRQKSIWLVSHREELAGRVPSVLKVVKENGFTSYATSTDIE
jgi:hypothetical protein